MIESNTAAQAAAVYVGHETNGVGQPRGSQIQISGSRVVGNLNVDANNQPTGGATIVVSESGRFNISRSFIQDNVGGAVLRADASDAAVPVSLDHCLVSGNTLQRGVVEALSGAPVEIRGSTIAGNALTGPVITASGNLRLEQAIVWQPGRQTALISGNRYIDDVVASEIGSLVVSPSVILRDPRFVDPQRADYSLQAASPAVDDSGVTSTTDLAGAAHDRDLALVADQYGVGDLGAYELQAIGNLVLNPGFLTDLRIWNVVRAGVSTWISAGANSTGSLKLEYDRSDTSMPPAGTLIGISQCVHIPGPGTYRLTGFAYGDGADNFERDHVSLHWTYRANSGGEACTGAISASGSVAFPSAAGFVAPTASAIIDIPAGQWTEYSTVEIAPAVVEGGFQVLATTTGHFDGIVLESVVVLPDGLFANGFE